VLILFTPQVHTTPVMINVQKSMFEYLNSGSSLEFLLSLVCRTGQGVLKEEVGTVSEVTLPGDRDEGRAMMMSLKADQEAIVQIVPFCSDRVLF